VTFSEIAAEEIVRMDDKPISPRWFVAALLLFALPAASTTQAAEDQSDPSQYNAPLQNCSAQRLS
jgi:hypothetical protein